MVVLMNIREVFEQVDVAVYWDCLIMDGEPETREHLENLVPTNLR